MKLNPRGWRLTFKNAIKERTLLEVTIFRTAVNCVTVMIQTTKAWFCSGAVETLRNANTFELQKHV